MIDDPRAEPPEARPTTQLEAVPAWAIELSKNVTIIRGNVELMSGDMVTMKSDIRGLQQWKLTVESNPVSIPPMTSTGVRALIDSHPSQIDLATQAQLADLMVKHAKEKADLEAKLVTKADVQAVVANATALQTTALLTEISQNKKLRVIAGLVAAVVIGWLGRMAATPPMPPPAPAPTTIQVPK